MATYLLTWVKENWSWGDFDADLASFRIKGRFTGRWSCGVTKKIIPRDRIFLIKLGSEPRGIVASGWTETGSYYDEHWDSEKASQGVQALYVDVNFDTLLTPVECFPFANLRSGIYSEMDWAPQASGRTIRQDIAVKLESDWAQFLNRTEVDRNPVFPDEAETEAVFVEGAVRSVTVNVYERDIQAREVCINHFGPVCQVCDFDFEERYGAIGKGFIHIHHLKALSEIGTEYELSPLRDLRPVCPNCHAMLHKKKPAYSIEELKRKLRRNK